MRQKVSFKEQVSFMFLLLKRYFYYSLKYISKPVICFYFATFARSADAKLPGASKKRSATCLLTAMDEDRNKKNKNKTEQEASSNNHWPHLAKLFITKSKKENNYMMNCFLCLLKKDKISPLR